MDDKIQKIRKSVNVKKQNGLFFPFKRKILRMPFPCDCNERNCNKLLIEIDWSVIIFQYQF